MRQQPDDIWDAFPKSDDFSSDSASGRLDWLGYATHSVSELEYQRMTQLLRERPEFEVELDAARQQLARLRQTKQVCERCAIPRNLAMRTLSRIASFARKTVGRPRMSPVRGPLDFGSGRGRLVDIAVVACTLAIVLTVVIPAIYQARQNAFWLSGQDHLRQWGHTQALTHAAYPQTDQSVQASSVRPMDFGIPSELAIADGTSVSPQWQGMNDGRYDFPQNVWQSSVPNRFSDSSQTVPASSTPLILSPYAAKSALSNQSLPTSDERLAEPRETDMESPEDTIRSDLSENYAVPDRATVDPTPYNTFGSYQVFHDGHVGSVSPLTSVSPTIPNDSDVPANTIPPLSFYVQP